MGNKWTKDNVKLVASKASTFDGNTKYFHNNLSIEDWKKSDKVDTIVKTTLRLCDFYLSSDNASKAPEDRIFIQNTALSKDGVNIGTPEEEIYYNLETRSIQKVLARMLEIGIIERFIFTSKDGSTYDWKGGSKEDWKALNGLTNRKIVLNINKVKELLSVDNQDTTYIDAEKKSTTRRFIMRRPFTLADLTRKLTNQQVKDVNARKKRINLYLLEQAKRFNAFSDAPVVTESTDLTLEEMDIIFNHIYCIKTPPLN